MFSELINIILIVSLVTIQSIVGVGILVVGTPALLLLDFSIIETMNYLLPISIITSLLNIFVMKYQSNSFYYNLDRIKIFFFICIPFVLFGLIILKYTNEFINYDYLVSAIIILTLILRKKISPILKGFSLRINKIILMVIGIIHGLTNSGGALLSILLSSLNNSKKESRSEITLFYFFLALIQFILFYFIFGLSQNFYKFHLVIIYIIIGTILGNILLKFTTESMFIKLIFFLALVSSTSLILKNIISN
jgi:uncharacterized membrane protein YfcA